MPNIEEVVSVNPLDTEQPVICQKDSVHSNIAAFDLSNAGFLPPTAACIFSPQNRLEPTMGFSVAHVRVNCSFA